MHRRYGAGMIYLKLRQAGQQVNHKRVDRVYAEAGLQVRRRKRKKVPVSDRQPLGRPQKANQVWSMDFVFDRTAEGRVIKCLRLYVNVAPFIVTVASVIGVVPMPSVLTIAAPEYAGVAVMDTLADKYPQLYLRCCHHHLLLSLLNLTTLPPTSPT